MSDIEQRKADHLELCTSGDVGFAHKRTLLGDVELVHDALPELRAADVDPATAILGKRLRAPLIIAAMTGGTPAAGTLNRELAQVAEARGYGFGLGSQRPLLEGRHEESFRVREVAPSCLLLGNLSGVLCRELPTARIAELAQAVGADAMCIHLNPAMELIQADGDRDFVGVTAALGRLARELAVPVVAKETGAGLGWPTVARLAEAGVRHVDVSGAGGTSWVAVEAARAEGPAAAVGTTLRDWGVPTAASVAYAAQASPPFETVIATGGIATGLDVARALVLGAHAAGLARPVLQALQTGGSPAVHELFDRIEAELRTVMLLCGARTVAELRRAPRVIRGELRAWLSAAGGVAVALE